MTETSVFTSEQLWMPGFIANPYPTYHHLRDQSPLNFMFLPAGAAFGLNEPIRGWALMKYEDVYNALRDHDTFVSRPHPEVGKLFPPLVLATDDPPRHTWFRWLVNKTFTLKRIEALTPWITRVANDLLDEMSTTRDRHCAVLHHRWSDAVFAFTSLLPEERAKSNQEMMAYFGRMAAARRAHGAEDLITALVEAEVEGEALEDWEILGFCMLLLIAGNESTTGLIGNSLNILVERPELWRRLREERIGFGLTQERTRAVCG